MKIESSDQIDYPLDQVYRALRDKLPEMVPYLNEVESIEVLEREDVAPGTLRLLNRWQGKPESIPKAVRPFVKREHIGFKDHATWLDKSLRVDWRFESLVGERYFECTGSNIFEALGGGRTQIEIVGELVVHPERFPGIPKFLAKKLKPRIEDYLVNLIRPNLASLATGVTGYLRASTSRE